MEELTFKDKLCELFIDTLGICPSFGRFLTKAFNIKFPHRDRIYLSKYWKAKEKNENISTLPKPEGLLRTVQLANLAILKEFDYVCRKNELNYWLIFGTLLGAKRHKGYIPWDDDIDVGVLRDDYNKLIEIFDKSTRNSDLYAKIIKNKHKPAMSGKNYMNYPPQISLGHISGQIVTKKEQKIMDELIKTLNN